MGTANRLTNTGTLYVNSKLNELTGMNISDNLLLNLDASKVANIANNTSTWTDIGPNQYNFSLINSPLYTSTTGYYTFNGTNQSAIATSNFADALSNMTVGAWIRTSSIIAGYYPPIINKCYNLGSTAGWSFLLFWDNVSDTRLGFLTQDGPTNVHGSTAVTTITTDGNWHYVAATLSGGANGTITLYQDGVQITNVSSSLASNGGSVTNFSTTTTVTIGSDVTQYYGEFLGNIADAQIYNRALSDGEILNNYNAKAALFGLTPTRSIPIIRSNTNTLFVNNIDEVSLNAGSSYYTSAGSVGTNAGFSYLQTNSSTLPWTALSGTFTIEFWANWNVLGSAVTAYAGVFLAGGGGFIIAFDGTSIAPRISGGAVGNIGTLINTYNPAFIPSVNRWYHIAVVRNSSNLIMMYVNGQPQGSGTTYSPSFSVGTWSYGNVKAGVVANGGQVYLSGLRISSAAIYTSTFSVPQKIPAVTGSTYLQLPTYNSTTFSRDAVTGLNLTNAQSALNGAAPAFNTLGPYNNGNNSLVQRVLPDGTLQNRAFVETTL